MVNADKIVFFKVELAFGDKENTGAGTVAGPSN